MKRTAAILAALLLAGIAWGQSSPPSADMAWASVLLVVGGVVALAGLVVALGAAWRVISRPWDRLQVDVSALRAQVEALHRIVRAPDDGGRSLLGRLEAVESQVAEHLADRERREDARDRLLQEVHLALRDFRRANGLDSNGT